MKVFRLGRSVGAIFLLSVLIPGWLPNTASAQDTVEVVQSVPLETTMALPGVRYAQEVWLEMINSAQTSLDLEQFYITDQAGESLQPVMQAIEKAVGRGVTLRVVMDSKFYATYPESVNHLAKLNGAQVRIIDFSPGVQHAKFFIVDGKLSFLGSQNFDWRALSHIHEIGVRLTSAKDTADLEKVFARDFAVAKPLSLNGQQTGNVSILSDVSENPTTQPDTLIVASPKQANPAGIPDSLTQILSLMQNAQKMIRVEVMEYTTKTYDGSPAWRVLDDAFRAAANRGVQVQLMIDSAKVQTAKKDLNALARIKNIEIRYITVPQWSGGKIDYARLIHSKYLVADGTAAWVGTENWSASYFLNTRNVGVILREQTPVHQLDQIFDRLWNSSYATKL